ncbi:hypothetical protein JCM3765_000226 [Sporobolomyces pararoseus]
MHFATLPLFVSAALPLVAGRPTPSTVEAIPLTRRDDCLTRRDGSVNLQVLENEMERLTGKYAVTSNSSLTHLGKRANSQALAYNGEALWTGPISVGTPPQIFQVYYDTASSDLALAASTCTDVSCTGKARYNSTASSTAKTTTFNVQSPWLEGTSGTGRLVRDTVTIGSSKVAVQDVVAQRRIGSSVAVRKADGLGLAFPDASAARSSSFPFSLFKQNPTAKSFSMRLSRVPGLSKLFFGGLDSSVSSAVPTYFAVARDPDQSFRTYWQIGQSTAFVDGAQAFHGRVNFILDSGTSVIIAPTDAAAELWATIPDSRAETSGYYSYPCSQTPNVELNFGGSTKRFAVNSADFNLGPVQGDSDRCLGAVVGKDLDIFDSWIIGSVFFQNWLLTFDVEGKRIGISPA